LAARARITTRGVLGAPIRALLADARRALGAYLGADADDVVFVPNATTALNIVERSIPLAPDDEVLGTDHEYGATEMTWQFACEKRGAAYVRAPRRHFHRHRRRAFAGTDPTQPRDAWRRLLWRELP
jgi:selenocysteine lyase/cysteine desulfurase